MSIENGATRVLLTESVGFPSRGCGFDFRSPLHRLSLSFLLLTRVNAFLQIASNLRSAISANNNLHAQAGEDVLPTFHLVSRQQSFQVLQICLNALGQM